MKKPISQADYLERMPKERRMSEKNTEPSLTVPGQAQTIMQIMSMFASGIPPISHTPIYNDGVVNETMAPDYDLVDAHQALKSIQESISKREAERNAIRDEANDKATQVKGVKRSSAADEQNDEDEASGQGASPRGAKRKREIKENDEA